MPTSDFAFQFTKDDAGPCYLFPLRLSEAGSDLLAIDPDDIEIAVGRSKSSTKALTPNLQPVGADGGKLRDWWEVAYADDGGEPAVTTNSAYRYKLPAAFLALAADTYNVRVVRKSDGKTLCDGVVTLVATSLQDQVGALTTTAASLATATNVSDAAEDILAAIALGVQLAVTGHRTVAEVEDGGTTKYQLQIYDVPAGRLLFAAWMKDINGNPIPEDPSTLEPISLE